MQAGKLRQRIIIEHRSEAANSFGEVIPTWATLTTVWGSVEPLSGKELLEAQQIASETTHRVRIRYYSSLTTEMRFKLGSRYLEIVSILNLKEAGRELEVLCKEAA